MAPKQPSKQKRAAQNRQQRAALEARRANARAEADAAGGTGGSTSSAGGGLLSRLRGGAGSGGASGPGGSARRPTGGRPTLSEARSMQPPGYRAALSALFAALAAIVLCTFMLRYPVNADSELYSSEKLVAEWADTALGAVADQPEASADEIVDSIEDWAPGRQSKTVIVALWPFSLAIVLPLIGAAIAFWAVRRRAPSKVVNRALYATLFGAVLTQGLLLLFTPVVLAVGVAMFQVRKAETIAAAQGAPAADDVIDVDEVEGQGADSGPADAEPVDSEPIEAEATGAVAGTDQVIEAEVVDDER